MMPTVEEEAAVSQKGPEKGSKYPVSKYREEKAKGIKNTNKGTTYQKAEFLTHLRHLPTANGQRLLSSIKRKS